MTTYSAQVAELTRCMESSHRVIGEQANKIAALRERVARLRLALGLLLAPRGGLDDLPDVLENEVHEQRSAGLPYEAEQDLLDALVDVQRNRDLEG